MESSAIDYLPVDNNLPLLFLIRKSSRGLEFSPNRKVETTYLLGVVQKTSVLMSDGGGDLDPENCGLDYVLVVQPETNTDSGLSGLLADNNPPLDFLIFKNQYLLAMKPSRRVDSTYLIGLLSMVVHLLSSCGEEYIDPEMCTLKWSVTMGEEIPLSTGWDDEDDEDDEPMSVFSD